MGNCFGGVSTHQQQQQQRTNWAATGVVALREQGRREVPTAVSAALSGVAAGIRGCMACDAPSSTPRPPLRTPQPASPPAAAYTTTCFTARR